VDGIACRVRLEPGVIVAALEATEGDWVRWEAEVMAQGQVGENVAAFPGTNETIGASVSIPSDSR